MIQNNSEPYSIITRNNIIKRAQRLIDNGKLTNGQHVCRTKWLLLAHKYADINNDKILSDIVRNIRINNAYLQIENHDG